MPNDKYSQVPIAFMKLDTEMKLRLFSFYKGDCRFALVPFPTSFIILLIWLAKYICFLNSNQQINASAALNLIFYNLYRMSNICFRRTRHRVTLSFLNYVEDALMALVAYLA